MMRYRYPAVLLLAAILFASLAERSPAAINSQGNVEPVPPPGGGSISSVLRVGNNTLGIMEIAGGTGLSQTADAFVGNGVDAIGYVTLSGLGSNWILINNSNDMTVGLAGLGTVSLEEFARVEVPGVTTVGSASTGVGEINIHGVGTIWETETAAIGVSGMGTVNITGGGRFATESSTLGTNNLSEGRVVIADALSQWLVTGGLTVGSSGRGAISVLDGGMLRTTIGSTLGNSLSGTGTVEVSGAGSMWRTIDGNVTVGAAGTGKLHVFDGGWVSVGGNLQLATSTASRGEVWVDGLGSVLALANSITSGVGESQLIISNGGEVTAGSLTWGASGRLTLHDGRLKVFSGGLSSLGLIQGSGVLEVNLFTNALAGQGSVQTRGRVQVAAGEHLRVTNTMVNNGLVDLGGGELEVGAVLTNNFDIDARNGAILRVGGTGLDNNSGAQLAITAGEVDVFGTVDNNSGAQILVAGGASAVFHDTVTNNGDLVVLSGSTLLAVEQLNLLGNQSNLRLNLSADDMFAESAPVQAAGRIILEGDLTVTFAGGYRPQAGDVFPLLASEAGFAGVFFNENLPGLSAGLDWDVQRTTNTMSLAVVEVAGLPGDFDNDGDVDGRDFLAWQRNPSVGDLADWQASYGVGATAGLSSSVVPEPSCSILMACCTAFALLQRRSAAYD
jgi:T5SS/PEP-CTERM-associated repeat protein